MLNSPPREAEPFTRITRRCRAVRSLPLAPSSVPLIPSAVRGLYRKERTDHGRQPALYPVSLLFLFLLLFLILFLTPRSLLPAPRSDHVLNKPGLGVRSPLDDDSPSPDGRVYPTQES